LVLEAFLYGLLSIVLLIAGFFVIDFVVPCDFRREIFDEKNTAVGALVGGLFIATGIIIRSSVIERQGAAQDWEKALGGLVSTFIYTGVGLALFVVGYLLLALLLRRHDLNRHIDEHNTAAGFALAGFFIAIALVVSGAIQ
jgi:uncharacterized membrane protein YjfL (UPF0719 family)